MSTVVLTGGWLEKAELATRLFLFAGLGLLAWRIYQGYRHGVAGA